MHLSLPIQSRELEAQRSAALQATGSVLEISQSQDTIGVDHLMVNESQAIGRTAAMSLGSVT